MKELEYPFDSAFILQNYRRIKRTILSEQESFVEKRIAILGGSTTANIVKCIELFLLNQGIKPLFYESDYNKYYEDALFSNPKLDEFNPEMVYIHTCNKNVLSYPTLADSVEDVEDMIEKEFERFCTIWESINSHFHCSIIQNNFEMPLYRLLGNKDASDIHGAVNFLTRLNVKLYEYAQTHDNFFICDINYISADYGLREWSNPFYWYMYKYSLCIDAIPLLAFNVSNILKSILGKNKKGMILDLDNTIWGGIVGDDGVDNLKMGPEESSGQVFSAFQNYIKAHKQLGVILCIDSKNYEVNAINGLNQENCTLKPQDFAVIKANWENKDKNILDISKELNVLPDSLVFIDDNPAERDIVTSQLKGVSAPCIGESHQYIQVIDRSGFFETTYFSLDDMKRSKMYLDNIKRVELKSTYSDYGEYLDGLEMKARIREFEPIYMERIAQLTNKSNQFNLTTKRLTQTEVESIATNDKYITLYGKLEDKFGDNGLVAISVGRLEGDICHIELWLMSCRVLKRDMEYAMMDEFIRECGKHGVKQINGYYYPSAKNGMVRDFYKTMGFKLTSEDGDGNTIWEYTLTHEYVNKNIHIKVEEEKNG